LSINPFLINFSFKQIFDNYFNRYQKIVNFEFNVQNESLIRVSPKLLSNNSLIKSNDSIITSINSSNINSNKSQTNPTIEPNTNTNERSVFGDKDYRDLELIKLKVNLSSECCDRYRKLFQIIKDVFDNNCDLITDYEWIHVIHNHMIQNESKQFEPKSWKNSFKQYLDLYLKVISFLTNK